MKPDRYGVASCTLIGVSEPHVGIAFLCDAQSREARQLPTLSDGVVLRARQASNVTLPRCMPQLCFEHERRQFVCQEIDVQKVLLPMIGMLATALACGCNSAKSPAAVATDVAEARQQASAEVTDARKDAAKNVESAAANADGSSKDLNDAGAKSAYDVAVAQADGDHNVAIQQCLALTGEAQKSCKERADAGYEQAKTHANVIRLSKLQ
jgi:hypothetical protein